jgi:hypothetical protein
MATPIKLIRKTNNFKKIQNSNIIDFTLPSVPSEPAEKLVDYSFLIYGRKKIGKTSLVSRFPKALFFMYEPGTKSQSVYKVPKKEACFTDWKNVRGFVKTLQKTKHGFATACFDPGNKAYDLCLRYVCEKEGIQHPGKMKDYGASWKAVSSEFEDIHLQIANANMAFVVIAHEKVEEYDGIDGKTYLRTVPKFSGATEDFYEGIIDNIFYYHYEGTSRFLQIRGTESVVAGTRCEGRFMTEDGRAIYKIPMGNSPDEAWSNLQVAWNNKQIKSYGPDEEKKEVVNKKILRFKKSH